jgi:hypothetical protein
MEELTYIKEKRHMFDDEGECPICVKKVEYTMTLPCCKTQLCSECFLLFNDGKTKLKCINCNSKLPLSDNSLDILINQINIHSKRFNELFNFLKEKQIKLTNEILDKIPIERLLYEKDNILILFHRNIWIDDDSDYKILIEYLNDKIPDLDWFQPVETTYNSRIYKGSLLLVLFWFSASNQTITLLENKKDFNERIEIKDGERTISYLTYLDCLSYYKNNSLDKEIYKNIINNSPIEHFNVEILYRFLENEYNNYAYDIYSNLGRLTSKDKILILTQSIKSKNGKLVNELLLTHRYHQTTSYKVYIKKNPLVVLLSDKSITDYFNDEFITKNGVCIRITEYIIKVIELKSYLENLSLLELSELPYIIGKILKINGKNEIIGYLLYYKKDFMKDFIEKTSIFSVNKFKKYMDLDLESKFKNMFSIENCELIEEFIKNNCSFRTISNFNKLKEN